jgi:hypothetical protein
MEQDAMDNTATTSISLDMVTEIIHVDICVAQWERKWLDTRDTKDMKWGRHSNVVGDWLVRW